MSPETSTETVRRWAVRLEQDAAEGRRLAAAFIQAFQTPESWDATEVAMNELAAWVSAGDEVAR